MGTAYPQYVKAQVTKWYILINSITDVPICDNFSNCSPQIFTRWLSQIMNITNLSGRTVLKKDI